MSNRSREDEILKLIEQNIVQDKAYFNKAKEDPAFNNIRPRLNRRLRQLVDQARSDSVAAIQRAESKIKDMEKGRSDEFSASGYGEAKEALRNARKFSDLGGYEEYLDSISEANKSYSIASDVIRQHVSSDNAIKSRVRSKSREINKLNLSLRLLLLALACQLSILPMPYINDRFYAFGIYPIQVALGASLAVFAWFIWSAADSQHKLKSSVGIATLILAAIAILLILIGRTVVIDPMVVSLLGMATPTVLILYCYFIWNAREGLHSEHFPRRTDVYVLIGLIGIIAAVLFMFTFSSCFNCPGYLYLLISLLFVLPGIPVILAWRLWDFDKNEVSDKSWEFNGWLPLSSIFAGVISLYFILFVYLPSKMAINKRYKDVQ